MSSYNVERSIKNVYMFQKDHDALIDFVLGQDPVRQGTGDLFGLWTTDGEPVIHIVCGQHLCTDRGSNFDATAREVRPLSHIGNWRCYDPSEVRQMDSNQLDHRRCNHNTRNTFLRLAICIKSGRQVILSPRLFHCQKHRDREIKSETVQLEQLAAESPFKNIKGINEIALNNRLDECLDNPVQMESSSSQVTKRGSPSNSLKQQFHTSVSKASSKNRLIWRRSSPV